MTPERKYYCFSPSTIHGRQSDFDTSVSVAVAIAPSPHIKGIPQYEYKLTGRLGSHMQELCANWGCMSRGFHSQSSTKEEWWRPELSTRPWYLASCNAATSPHKIYDSIRKLHSVVVRICNHAAWQTMTGERLQAFLYSMHTRRWGLRQRGGIW